jgi:tetratricopeptide (TPR) repeat protein
MATKTKKAQRTSPDNQGDAKPLPSSRRGAPSEWAIAALLAICIGLVYCRGSVLRAPFIFDDLATITNNGSLKSLWPLVGPAERPGPLNPSTDSPTAGRPLVNLTFALNYALGRLNPFSYHLVNVFIHFLSSLLAWSIVRRTLLLPYFAGRFDASAGWLATAVALVWALHPLQTETVEYVTQRTELMVAFFYLATLYCSLRYWSTLPLPLGEGRVAPDSPRRGKGALDVGTASSRPLWLALAVISCLCGMASKEVMASAPLIVLLYERTFVSGSLKSALQRSWPLYTGLSATWIVLLWLNISAPRGESAGFGLGVGAVEWWLTQSKILLMYLKLAVWPSPLLFHYELPYLKSFADAWMYVIPVLLLVVGVLVLLWRNHPIGFLGTWMLAVLAPTLLVPVILEMAAERRIYLPLLSLVILAVVGGYRLIQRTLQRYPDARWPHPVCGALVLLLTMMLSLLSARRLSAYTSEIRLWQEVLQDQSGNFMAHNNLGRLYIDAGRYPEAIEESRKCLAIKPDHYSALNNLGVALDHTGRYDEAIQALNQALELKPDYVDALQNLANSLRSVGRYPEALEKMEYALRLKPDNAEANNNMGVLLASTGKSQQALAQFREAARLDPNYPAAYINLAKMLSASGNVGEAVGAWRHAVRLQPNRADLHNELGAALRTSGQIDEAIEHFQIALNLDPKFAKAYGNLALSLALLNRPEDAILASQRAIEVARATGQTDVEKATEEWLTHYRAELQAKSKQGVSREQNNPQNN